MFYWVLLYFIGFYCVLLGFIGFYWVLLGFIGFYWVLLGLKLTALVVSCHLEVRPDAQMEGRKDGRTKQRERVTPTDGDGRRRRRKSRAAAAARTTHRNGRASRSDRLTVHRAESARTASISLGSNFFSFRFFLLTHPENLSTHDGSHQQPPLHRGATQNPVKPCWRTHIIQQLPGNVVNHLQAFVFKLKAFQSGDTKRHYIEDTRKTQLKPSETL